MTTLPQNPKSQASQAFIKLMTEEYELCLKGWLPVSGYEEPFPCVEERYKRQAEAEAARILQQNIRNAREMAEDADWMMEIVEQACREAGFKVERSHAVFAQIIDELKRNAYNEENFYNTRGHLFILSRGRRGKTGRGKVPLRFKTLVEQLLGKAPQLLDTVA